MVRCALVRAGAVRYAVQRPGEGRYAYCSYPMDLLDGKWVQALLRSPPVQISGSPATPHRATGKPVQSLPLGLGVVSGYVN
jgi:hypothetical protein